MQRYNFLWIIFKNHNFFVSLAKNMAMRYTVITINYNNTTGLQKTINSVINQTYKEFEYIVVDGGSTDGSVELIKKFSGKIDYWVSEKDKGIYHAMNKGVTHAHGDYCLFLNSGDVFYDYNVLKTLDEPNFTEDILIGLVVIDKYNHIISPPPEGELTLYHLYSGAVPHQGAFIRTILLRKYPYDETLKISSDWKFFVQVLILQNCSVRYIDKYVAMYDTGGFSSKHQELMRQEKDRVLAEFFPPRVIADYCRMKNSECLTQTITPQLRKCYRRDKFLYKIGKLILKFDIRL